MQSILIILSVIVLGFSEASSVPKLYAHNACLYDCDSGRFLYNLGGDTKCSVASTTKIMTLILALEYGNMDDIVVFSKYAASRPKVKLGVNAGDRYRLIDMCYAMMLESYNDVAVAIAEHIAGSEEAFATLMNKKALELGCNNTHFVTANGLDKADEEGEHMSTAKDMAVISAYAINNDQFLEIVGTKKYTFADVDNKRVVNVTNKDNFLNMYDGAVGIKTGFTSRAGYCFVGCVIRDDVRLVGVVLGCGYPPNKSYKWKDMIALIDYGFMTYKKIYIFDDYSLLLSDLDTPVLCHNAKDGAICIYLNGQLVKKYTKKPL